MRKEYVKYTYNELSFSLQKEGNPVIWNNMGEPSWINMNPVIGGIMLSERN